MCSVRYVVFGFLYVIFSRVRYVKYMLYIQHIYIYDTYLYIYNRRKFRSQTSDNMER